MQLLPDLFIGPAVEVLLRIALNVKSADSWTAHAEQSETPFMMRIDELLGGRRGLGQNSQPSERIILLIDGKSARGDGGAADAVEAVAAGDEITRQLLLAAVMAESDPGPGGIEIMHAHIGRFEENHTSRG